MALLDATDRRLLRLAGPAFLTLAAEPLYVLADTAIVGHIGTAPLGGLAIAGTILSTVTWLVAFLASGVTTQVAQRRGAGDEAGARGAVSQGFAVAVVLGSFGALLVGLGASTLARTVGGKGDVLHDAVTYLRIAVLGLPAIALTLLARLVPWYGRPPPVRVAIGANVANLALEMLFVWVLHGGIGGSAWATVIVQWGTVVAYGVALRGVIEAQRPRLEAVRALLRIGVAMIIRTGVMVASTAATWLASRSGDVALGAHQIGVQITMLLALMVDSLAISSQSVFANQLGRAGAGASAELWAVTRRLTRLGLLAGLSLAVVVAASSPVLGHLFSSDREVLRRSVGVLLGVAAIQVSGAMVFVLDGVLMGADLFSRLAVAAIAAATVFWAVAGFQRTSLPVLSGLGGVWVALNLWMVARLAGNVALARRHLRPQVR